jgi:hypothetical protein
VNVLIRRKLAAIRRNVRNATTEALAERGISEKGRKMFLDTTGEAIEAARQAERRRRYQE